MIPFPDFSAQFPVRDGFTRPEWQAIDERIEKEFPEDQRGAVWQHVTHRWLQQLCVELGGAYRICETPNFLLVTDAPDRIARDAGQSCEAALKGIVHRLGEAVGDLGSAKQVVLMFARLDEYYRYLLDFYAEGEQPMSGGMCLTGSGYLHYAFTSPDYSAYRRILVHELTHGCLAHLPLPVWLNEALAMHMEQVVCGAENVLVDGELYDRHTAHWNEETIQMFWTGESWDIPGESFDLSYSLAQVLWQKIEIDRQATQVQMMRFVNAAEAGDGGEAAFRSVFGVGLGDMVASFLGEGEWKPDPERWSQGEPEETAELGGPPDGGATTGAPTRNP